LKKEGELFPFSFEEKGLGVELSFYFDRKDTSLQMKKIFKICPKFFLFFNDFNEVCIYEKLFF